jgi:chromosomal replication initiator protein
MTDPDLKIWDGMLAHLRANHASICRQWFGELEPVGIAGGAVQVRTRSPLHRDYLKRECSTAFNDAARTVSGHLLSVRFLGPEDEATPPPRKNGESRPAPLPKVDLPPSLSAPAATPTAVPTGHAPSPRPPAQTEARYESLIINPDYCFENFIVGSENRLAHAAALAVAANPGRAYNPLFVHGGVGLGKTHLLQAVCLRIVEANPRTRLYYTSCEGFLTKFIESVQSGEMSDFRHRFRDVDILVIDDIHFLGARERSQEEFFHTFNSLYQSNKQIILSSDAPPEEIPDLEERLVSRFKWGVVAKIGKPDNETRIEIIKTKGKMRSIVIPDDVAAFVAGRIDSNIRELEGVVVQLLFESGLDKRPIDLELARKVLGDAPAVVVGEPTIQTIINAVVEHYGVRLTDLQSPQRHRSVALPRQVCMYLARETTRHSLAEIGGFFGGRDHTTVMHAMRAIERRRTADTDFDVLIRSLLERVRTGPRA